MPWEVKERDGKHCVFKKGGDTPIKGGCHADRADAVKHMRALYAAEPSTMMKYSAIAYSDDLFIDDAEDQNIKWLKTWRYSTWEHPKYGTVEITPQVGERFANHFHSGTLGREHLINYDHGADAAKGGIAAGVILDIEPREDGVYYKVKFHDDALEEIRSGKWRYLSPEFDDWVNPDSGEVFEDMPFDLALTNTPFFKGMPPLNFSEVFDQKDFKELGSAQKNDLPDSAFLYIEPGGKRDNEGRTTPRSFRHLPVKEAEGSIDLPHLRNAIARLSQSDTGKGWLSDSLRSSLLSKARRMLSNAGGNPKGGKVDELLKKFAAELGLDLDDEMDEDAVIAAAKNLNETIEPLRRAKTEGAKQRIFRESFPEQYKEMQELKAKKIDSEALQFAESYARFTLSDGDNTWKSAYGFSQLVIDEIAEVHKKFSERSAGHVDLKKLLDLIGDKGIVDYSEVGSSRTAEGKLFSEDPKLAFHEAIVSAMNEDNLEYEAAMEVAKVKYPEMYEKYLRAVPQ